MSTALKGSNPLSTSVYNSNYSLHHSTVGKTVDRSSVVNATLVLLGIVALTILAVVFLGQSNPGLAAMASLAGVFGTIVMAFVTALSKSARQGSAPIAMIFSVFEGLMLGGMTFFIGNQDVGGAPGWIIVSQAVIGTVGLFFVALTLYGSGIIKPTRKFNAFLAMAIGGFGVMYLINLGITLVTGNNLLFSEGPIPIIIAAVAIVLGTLSLISELDMVDNATNQGYPDRFKWSMATAIMTSLAWLYMELLRLLYLLVRR